ncbi:MAG: ABC transporter substrate-binding protein [Oscillospiraceae bacterium]|nr:ABC transporter substrate-binding protein [Oscillospiraceae bacterium]
MKKIIALVLVLLMSLGVLSACGEKDDELTKITLSEVAHSVFYAPQYAALKLGFFEEEGLEIELINGGGADKVMTSVLTGEAQIGFAGPEACIYVLLEGHEDAPKVFAQMTNRDGAFLVGRTDEDFSWENLRGKTIIGGRKGGVPEMTLEYVMRQNGVIPHEDAVVDTSVQFNMMGGAFTGGNGDYVALFEPTATEVEQAGQGYILASIGEESGDIPYTAYFASQSYMSDNPDVIQGFTNAVAKGLKWVSEHTDREVAEVIAEQFPDTDLDVLETVVGRYRSIDAWKETPVMEQEDLERLETVMETAGELSERVEFTALVDNSFAEKSAAK